MSHRADTADLRIGELGRRTGVDPELLRAWERRYGLLAPTRTGGGFRLYTEADVERVRRMKRHIADGLSAHEAASRTLADETETRTATTPVVVDSLVAELGAALEAFDDVRAHEAFDRLLATVSVETLITTALLPYLHDLGERWSAGEISVAQEHFASNVLRGRLLGLARGWDRGVGPSALLACPPGEHHDIALVMLGLSLRAHGWRITFLGQDTPLETLAQTAALTKPDLVVLSITTQLLGARDLASLARLVPVAVVGPRAAEVPARDGVIVTPHGDPVATADALARR